MQKIMSCINISFFRAVFPLLQHFFGSFFVSIINFYEKYFKTKYQGQDAHQGYTSGCYVDIVQDFVDWPKTEVSAIQIIAEVPVNFSI